MALRNRRDGNREAIEAFANQFDPPLNITQTRAVGGITVTNGWMAAHHDEETELGITAVVWGGGHMKIFMEVQTTAAEAESFGDFFGWVIVMSKVEEEERQRINTTVWRTAGGVAEPGDTTLAAEPQAWDEQIARDEARMREELKGSLWPQAALYAPNPARIDMTELHPREQHALVRTFPELAFKLDSDGQRYRIERSGTMTRTVADDAAGYCSEMQLARVRVGGAQLERDPIAANMPRRRSIPRPAPASAGIATTDVAVDLAPEVRTPMGAKPKPNCQHDWRRNSIGGGMTCAKCGGFEATPSTRSDQARINAERRLADMAEAESRCLAERGAHSLVVIDRDGQRLGVCRFCGAEVPQEETAVLEVPGASDAVSGD